MCVARSADGTCSWLDINRTVLPNPKTILGVHYSIIYTVTSLLHECTHIFTPLLNKYSNNTNFKVGKNATPFKIGLWVARSAEGGDPLVVIPDGGYCLEESLFDGLLMPTLMNDEEICSVYPHTPGIPYNFNTSPDLRHIPACLATELCAQLMDFGHNSVAPFPIKLFNQSKLCSHLTTIIIVMATTFIPASRTWKREMRGCTSPCVWD